MKINFSYPFPCACIRKNKIDHIVYSKQRGSEVMCQACYNLIRGRNIRSNTDYPDAKKIADLAWMSDPDYLEHKRKRDEREKKLNKQREKSERKKFTVNFYLLNKERITSELEAIQRKPLIENHWNSERKSSFIPFSCIVKVLEFLGNSSLQVFNMSKDWREAFIYRTDFWRPSQDEFLSIVYNSTIFSESEIPIDKFCPLRNEFFSKLLESYRKNVKQILLKASKKYTETKEFIPFILCLFYDTWKNPSNEKISEIFRDQEPSLCFEFLKSESGEACCGWSDYYKMAKEDIYEVETKTAGEFQRDFPNNEVIKKFLSEKEETALFVRFEDVFFYTKRHMNHKDFFRHYTFAIDEQFIDNLVDFHISRKLLEIKSVLRVRSPCLIEAIMKNNGFFAREVTKIMRKTKKARERESLYGHWLFHAELFGNEIASLYEDFPNLRCILGETINF